MKEERRWSPRCSIKGVRTVVKVVWTSTVSILPSVDYLRRFVFQFFQHYQESLNNSDLTKEATHKADAPEMISTSSIVILACLALLY